MFLGLTNSATEILRDRPTLRRERNCHPIAWLYVTSKFSALSLVAGAQCFAYLLVGNTLLGLRGLMLEHWIWMTLTCCTGTAMALFVSSIVRTERAALTSVPLLLVPQMLLAGALVPFPEMNRALFEDSALNRDRGGAPVPAFIMPLRYAYEAMVVTQATRNPFELQRQRVQRRIDLARDRDEELSMAAAERLDILKAALTRLLASGAENPNEARRLVRRLGGLARSGTRIEVETLDVWPENSETARPCSEFFVNSRIDLMVRQAESYRTDYRNTTDRNVFLAESKYFAGREIDTVETTAAALFGTSLLCLIGTTFVLRFQGKSVR